MSSFFDLSKRLNVVPFFLMGDGDADDDGIISIFLMIMHV